MYLSWTLHSLALTKNPNQLVYKSLTVCYVKKTKITFSRESVIADIICIDQVIYGKKGNLAVVNWRRCAARHTVTNETYGRPLSVPHTLGGRIFFTLLERWLHTFVYGLEEAIE